VLQAHQAKSWQDLYAFSLEPQCPADFEVANYYTSTHPDSRFVRMLTAQLPTPEARYVLRNRELTIDRGDRVARRMVTDDGELLELLQRRFGLHLPHGARLPFLRQEGGGAV
jgi:N-hydroxyarylamine O-acetyltransferase